MRRAGGYSTYWAAHARLLLADSRPLDAASANRLPAGSHEVQVVEVRNSWGWVQLELEGRARRRIITPRIYSGRASDRLWPALAGALEGLKPGQLGAAAPRLLRRRARIRVVDAGDVEVRVCPDGSYALMDRDGLAAQLDTLAEVDSWMEATGARRVEPRVISLELLPPT
jgi:hypothetical protein